MENSFGKTIKKLRQVKGYSIREFAHLVQKPGGNSISPSYLCDVEQERRNPPNHKIIGQMAGLLGVPEDFLLGLAEKTSPEIPDLIREQPEIGRLLRRAKQTGFKNWKAVERLIDREEKQ